MPTTDQSQVGRSGGAASFVALLSECFQTAGVHPPSRKLARGATLYGVREPGDCVYLIERGWLKRTMSTSGGKVAIVSLAGPGDLVGEDLPSGRARVDTAVAMSPSVVRVIHHDQLSEIVRLNGLREIWNDYLFAQIQQQQEIIFNMITLNSECRLATCLLRVAAQSRSGSHLRARLGLRLTQEELSGMIGTTRSRVGHFMANFERHGLIDRSESCRITVCPSALRDFVECDGEMSALTRPRTLESCGARSGS